MNMRLLLSMACLLLATAAHAADVSSVEQIHEPTFIRESPGNEAKAVGLPDDSLRIYFIKRPEGTELRSISSSDGGLTWSEEKVEIELPGQAYHAIQVTLDDQDELHAVFHIRGEGDKGYRGRHYNLWHAKTTGGRKQWTQPKQFFEGYVGSIRGLTRLSSGRLLLAVSVAVPEREKPPAEGEVDLGWNDAVTFHSDDRGHTWTMGSSRLVVPQDNTRGRTRYGAVEPYVIELKDGRVWMLIRTKNGQLWESFSSDGIEWSPAKPTKLISSDSPASLTRMRDGRLLMIFNACQKWDDPMSYAIGGREVLHAAISSDEGKTWKGMREILRDPHGEGKGDRGTAYGEIVHTADDKLLVVSGQGDGRRSVLLLDPDWLAETQASDDFSNGGRDWTMYYAQGAEAAAHPDDPQRKALVVRKIDPQTPAAAVWNFPTGAAGELKLRMQLKDGAKPAIISLTDHYSVAGDKQAHENALYTFTLDAKALKPGQWHDLAIAWSPGGAAKLTIDGQAAGEAPPKRPTHLQICYLRLMSGAPETDPAGFIVDRVEVKVQPPGEPATAAAPRLGLEKIAGDATGGAVLDLGEAGAFDATWVTCPSVLFDGEVYRMWYSSHYSHREGKGGIGLATSRDGMHWQRANGGQAVLASGEAGAFDAALVMGPHVLFDGETYRMWYTGDNGQIDASGIVVYQIGLVTSTDGINWTRANDGRPVLSTGPAGSHDAVQAATPSVLRARDGYRMWYAAWSPQHNHTICTAVSSDGIEWRRENNGQPVSGLEPSIAYGHSVCRIGDDYLMLYMALGATRGLYAARSSDGSHWQMLNDGQPVLLRGSTGQFDQDIVGHPFLMHDNGRLRAWYTGYQCEPGGVANWRLRIGLAAGNIR